VDVGATLSTTAAELVDARATALVDSATTEVERVVGEEMTADDEAIAAWETIDEELATIEVATVEDEATTEACVEAGTADVAAAAEDTADDEPELEEPPGPETLVVRSPDSI